MPKFKVTISLGKYEETVEAPNESAAQNMVEENFYLYLQNDVNCVDIKEVK